MEAGRDETGCGSPRSAQRSTWTEYIRLRSWSAFRALVAPTARLAAFWERFATPRSLRRCCDVCVAKDQARSRGCWLEAAAVSCSVARGSADRGTMGATPSSGFHRQQMNAEIVMLPVDEIRPAS